MRFRFILWWNNGYCNGSGDMRSFGLGGNISTSFQNFYQQRAKEEYMVSDAKNISTRGSCSGNGSLMRLEPIPIAFWQNEELAMENAALSSLTTHDGHEAAECCRLLAFLVVRAINHDAKDYKNIREFLD